MKPIALFLTLSFLIGGIGASTAQTMSYADAISQLAAACERRLAQILQGHSARRRV